MNQNFGRIEEKNSPNIDILLHDHLDGAFPIRSSANYLYSKNGLVPPVGKDLGNFIAAKFDDVHGDIIAAFKHVVDLLQSYDTIRYAVKNHIIVRARQGIKYVEFMLAPHYHLNGEFKKLADIDPVSAMVKVIKAAIDGIKDAEEMYPDVEANFLVAIGRELSTEKAIQVLKAIERCDQSYAVGFNLVCDEASFPPELHIETYDYAAAAEINADCHISEWVRGWDQKPDFDRDLPGLIRNLRTGFLKLKNLKRAGHCIALGYDDEMLKLAVDRGIGITACPGSNLHGGNIPNLKALRLRKTLDAGALISINPDDDMFHPLMPLVIRMLQEEGFTKSDFDKFRLNGWKTRLGNRKPVPEDIRKLV